MNDGTFVEHDPSPIFEPEDIEATRQDGPHDDWGGQSRALIVLNQPICAFQAFLSCYDACEWRIYADGGAGRVAQLIDDDVIKLGALSPELVIGDLDSIDLDTETYFAQHGASIVRDPDQYSTDFGKAVKAIATLQSYGSREGFKKVFGKELHRAGLEHRVPLKAFVSDNHALRTQSGEGPPSKASQGARPIMDVIVFSGLGGRLDQGLGLLSETFKYQTDAASQTPQTQKTPLRFWLVTERNLSWVLEGPTPDSGMTNVRHRLQLTPQANLDSECELFTRNVGILPVYGPAKISTKGLEWDVADWETEMTGQVSTSNHVVSEDGVIEITTSANVLFTVELGKSMLDLQ